MYYSICGGEVLWEEKDADVSKGFDLKAAKEALDGWLWRFW